MAKTKDKRDELAGNEPSSPESGYEQIKQAEEKSIGRSSSVSSNSTTGGKTSFNTGKPKKTESDDLSNSTAPGSTTLSSDDPETSFYKSGSDASSQTHKGRFKLSIFGLSRRRKVFGGGILGTIVGILMFGTFLSGPFEFIHLAHLLEQFHFAGLQTVQDDRFAKEARLFRYATKGQVENSRLSYLGNKFANRFEAKLNASGLSSSYSKTFGLFDGYVIDENNEKFKNMTPEEIQETVKAKYGADVVRGSEIKGSAPEIASKLVIDTSNMSLKDTFKMNYGLLREAGYSKVSAATGARYLCTRAACTSMLHPLTKKVAENKRSLEEWWKNRAAADENGSRAAEVTAAEEDPDAPKNPGAEDVKAEAKGDTKLSAKDISAKLGGGAAAVAGVLCVAKGVASDAHSLKESQLQVLMRVGVEAMAVGNQFESGHDVNLAQAADYKGLLDGVDSSGNKTSWDQAESIQANLGHPNTGIPPSKTLQTVTNDGTPFDFLNTLEPLATILGGVCSTVGQAITFLGGGIEGLVQGAVVSIILSQTSFASDLAHWLAGSAVDVNAVGADFGSEADFGTKLAANGQSMLSGGDALSTTQASAMQSTINQIAQENFDSQSVTHKLFNPYDNQSVISKVIDSTGASPSQTLAKMGSSFFNFGHIFSSFSSIFGGQAQAATAGYNYGFPTYGFSQQELADKTYGNPYENACHVTGCGSENIAGKSVPIIGFLTGTSTDGAPISATGQVYVDQAKKCFGATISQVSSQTDQGLLMQWDVTSSGDKMPNPYDDSYPDYCKNNPDPNWARLRFFIMDTQVMNSMGCYLGDETDPAAVQACTDIGVNQAATPAG